MKIQILARLFLLLLPTASNAIVIFNAIDEPRHIELSTSIPDYTSTTKATNKKEYPKIVVPLYKETIPAQSVRTTVPFLLNEVGVSAKWGRRNNIPTRNLCKPLKLTPKKLPHGRLLICQKL